MRTRLVLVGLAVLLACSGGGDGPTNPASASIAGTYALQKINGSNLPFLLQSGSTTVTIVADALTVTDGGTWSETLTYRASGSASNQTSAASGSYTRAGSAVTFLQGSTLWYSGTFTGTGLNLADNVASYTFVR